MWPSNVGYLAASDLFGAHIARRAEGLPDHRDVFVGVVGVENLGDPEVENLEDFEPWLGTVLEDQIGGLEVAVNDPPIVGELEGVGELAEHSIDLDNRQGFAG